MTTKKQSGISSVFIISFAALIIVAGVFLSRGMKSTFDNGIIRDSEQPDQITEDTFLYTRFPDFDSLSYEDIPNLTDVRKVFEYNGNLLVMGWASIVEYDTSADAFIRATLPTEVLMFDVAKIEDTLYAADNGNSPDTPAQPTLYVVDLKTGKLLNSMQGTSEVLPYDLTNPSLHSYEKDLWISTRDYVLKFDTVSQTVTENYTLEALGYKQQPTCDNAPFMVSEPGVVKVVEFACKNFISTYNYDTNTWAIESSSNLDPSDYINKGAEDFGIEFPYFGALSKMVGDAYYLSSDRGIYVITRNSLPKIHYAFKSGQFRWGASFISTKDGVNFVLASFGITEGIESEEYLKNLLLRDAVQVKLVNSDTQEVIDLIEKPEYRGKKYMDVATGLYGDMYGATTELTDTEYIIRDGEGNTVLRIDLGSKNLEFGTR